MELEKSAQKEKAKIGSWRLYLTLPIMSWAFYDFANTIFSSNINTIFWPFYMQEVVGNNEVLKQVANTFIAYANALASFFLVLFSPLFGVMIDRTGRKKKYIIIFTIISVAATALMGVFAMSGLNGTIFGLPVFLALVILCFIIAKFFFHSSLVFYDSMISDLGAKEEIPLISGFGVAIGYLGTLLGLSVYLFVGDGDFHRAFIPTAILFLVFSLPLFFFVKDKPKKAAEKSSFISGYKEIYKTFKEMRSHKTIFTFMIAYFFLNDAIATTIAMMAPYATTIVGFSAGQFILLYLVSTISSIIGSFIFGYITKAVGANRAVKYVGVLLLVALIIGTFAINELMFWIAGSMFGIALGSMWVTTRTYIVDLTPEDKRGQFFGLFAFSGKVSSIIGPLLFGTITLVFAEYGNIASRLGMGSLIILTIIGLVVHLRIKENPQTEY
ncbi:MFS transporter [Cytobacillus horneckiae]|uniref:MFS transporter n=1 Tax=Cytobacillus horneckiae TaxID=549687 RepID=A0A2N0Z8Y0_9BACI|nr:MFS transporter [Cytobacillus horneckiae]NRG46034.1 MFS transporter [Bacillus sp. CRN 9]MBN6889233.1 MFS transporter [Cytobacillus horneckiae]MCM3178453.1 MFS transporter [Cytobacillus horneckiae]MEC1156809.1 MFS transporter [Cytobacillus horneckiae]MED2940569.1 MFS transporter [Cytobacillus horneckiae]